MAVIKYVIGVDPGLDGAIVLLGDASPFIVPMPVKHDAVMGRKTFDVDAIAEVVGEFYLREASELWIEEPGTFPFIKQTCAKCGTEGPARKSAQASRSQGYCHGLFEMACVAYGIKFNAVPARTWQKIMLGANRGDDTKKLSIAWAQKHYPNVSLLRTERCSVASDGMADALCIAAYGQRVLGVA